MEYSEKYGYAPDREKMDRALNMIAANLDNLASEQVYKDCFSMMDLTTLKTDDTPASVKKLVNKVNTFRQTRPDWPLPAWREPGWQGRGDRNSPDHLSAAANRLPGS